MVHKDLNFIQTLDFIKHLNIGTDKTGEENLEAPEESNENGIRVPFALDIIKDKDSKIGHRFSLHDPLGLFSKKEEDVEDGEDHQAYSKMVIPSISGHGNSIHSAEFEPRYASAVPEFNDWHDLKDILDEAQRLTYQK